MSLSLEAISKRKEEEKVKEKNELVSMLDSNEKQIQGALAAGNKFVLPTRKVLTLEEYRMVVFGWLSRNGATPGKDVFLHNYKYRKYCLRPDNPENPEKCIIS